MVRRMGILVAFIMRTVHAHLSAVGSGTVNGFDDAGKHAYSLMHIQNDRQEREGSEVVARRRRTTVIPRLTPLFTTLWSIIFQASNSLFLPMRTVLSSYE